MLRQLDVSAPNPHRRAPFGVGTWLLVACATLAGCAEFEYRLGGESLGSGGSSGSGPVAAGLVGWAATAECGPLGTTGGAAGPRVRVTSADELRAAAGADEPRVIEIAGRLELGSETVDIASDKTLVGVSGGELVGHLRVNEARNVILQHLRLDGSPTTGTTDTLEVTGSTCVWIDHCDVFDGADGNLDIVRGSDLVTVSWSKFYYAAKDHDHRYSNLCGNANDDTPGKINVTFHHNWWSAGVVEQMPRVRHGKVHVFNNYYSAVGNNYCIGAGYLARLVVQNNVFEGVTNPITYQYDELEAGSGLHTAEVVATGNDTSTATGEFVTGGAAFVPPYEFSLESAANARTRVIADAGAR